MSVQHQTDNTKPLVQSENQASLLWTHSELENSSPWTLPEFGTILSWIVPVHVAAISLPQPDSYISKASFKIQAEKPWIQTTFQTLSTFTSFSDKVQLQATHKIATVMPWIQFKIGTLDYWTQSEYTVKLWTIFETGTIRPWIQSETNTVNPWTQPKTSTIRALTQAESQQVRCLSLPVPETVTLLSQAEMEAAKHLTMSDMNTVAPWTLTQNDTIKQMTQIESKKVLSWFQPERTIAHPWIHLETNIVRPGYNSEGNAVQTRITTETNTVRFWTSSEIKLWTQSESQAVSMWPEDSRATLWSLTQNDTITSWFQLESQRILSWAQFEGGITNPWTQQETATTKLWTQFGTLKILSWTPPDTIIYWFHTQIDSITPMSQPQTQKFQSWMQTITQVRKISPVTEVGTVIPWLQFQSNTVRSWIQLYSQTVSLGTHTEVGIIGHWTQKRIATDNLGTNSETQATRPWDKQEANTVRTRFYLQVKTVRLQTYSEFGTFSTFIRSEIGTIHHDSFMIQSKTQEVRPWTQSEIVMTRYWVLSQVVKPQTMLKGGTFTPWIQSETQPATPWTKPQVNITFFSIPVSDKFRTWIQPKTKLLHYKADIIVSLISPETGTIGKTLLIDHLDNKSKLVTFLPVETISTAHQYFITLSTEISTIERKIKSSYLQPSQLTNIFLLTLSSKWFPSIIGHKNFGSILEIIDTKGSLDVLSVSLSYLSPGFSFLVSCSLTYPCTLFPSCLVFSSCPYLSHCVFPSCFNFSSLAFSPVLLPSTSSDSQLQELSFSKFIEDTIFSHTFSTLHAPPAISLTKEFPLMPGSLSGPNYKHQSGQQPLNVSLAECRLGMIWKDNLQALWLFKTAVVSHETTECGLRPGLVSRCPNCWEAETGPKGPLGPGLIFLKQPLHFQPLVLPTCLEESLEQEKNIQLYDCWLPSWSLMRGSPGILQKRHLNILQASTCAQFWPKLNEFAFCVEAKKAMGEAGCKGDLGAPLVCHIQQKDTWVQVGILSHFDEHCTKPYVFSQVSPFIFWIQGVTRLSHAPWSQQGPITTSASISLSVSPARNASVLTSTTASIRPHFISLPQPQSKAQ
ncbi:uncharacterized protein isoform X3 [Castor canadensis]|uniref:Uncharacterized protein isoform X3 n=1 Tax=Castor canadensis TaxID=51338 RepID=A0AC58LMR2_CASCN